MALTERHRTTLENATREYEFPTTYYDFAAHAPVAAASLRALESTILSQLSSSNLTDVEHGLANVIYWGNVTAGYRDHRRNTFQTAVNAQQLARFQALVMAGRVPTLLQIRTLMMPGYSGMSFISKILMFLNPALYCVLDLQLLKLRTANGRGALNRIKHTTTIPLTAHNCAAYEDWRAECLHISATYFGGRYGAADIERGFFHLIQSNRIAEAQEIYNSASDAEQSSDSLHRD
jgi:hypothetical protein